MVQGLACCWCLVLVQGHHCPALALEARVVWLLGCQVGGGGVESCQVEEGQQGQEGEALDGEALDGGLNGHSLKCNLKPQNISSRDLLFKEETFCDLKKVVMRKRI